MFEVLTSILALESGLDDPMGGKKSREPLSSEAYFPSAVVLEPFFIESCCFNCSLSKSFSSSSFSVLSTFLVGLVGLDNCDFGSQTQRHSPNSVEGSFAGFL